MALNLHRVNTFASKQGDMFLEKIKIKAVKDSVNE